MPTFSFLVTKAMNEIPEFLHRIDNQALVEFNKVIPSFTVLSEDKILHFAKGVWTDDFRNDYGANTLAIERAFKGLDQATHQEGLGEIFITNIPWYSFTAIHHPYSKSTSSIPIVSTGKIYQDKGREIIPFGIQTHHALVDGYHIGLLMKKLEHFLDNPTQFIF
jgi:chloramphenicol O-acetyltransferase type A